MEINTRSFFPSLAGLRVLLASFVFIYHFHNGTSLYLATNQLYVLIKFCMTAFFSLSGFVITYSLLNRPTNNLSDYLTFFGNKIIRLFPLYLILYLVPFTDINFPGSFVFFTNLTLLKGYFNKLHLGGIGPAWSLTTELTFYLFAPLIVKLLRDKKKAFICYLSFVAAGFLLTFLGNILSKLNLNPYGFCPDIFFTLEVTFFGRVTDFYIGVLLAYFTFTKRESNLLFLTKLNITYLSILLLILTSFLVVAFNLKVDNEDQIASVFLQNLILPLIAGFLLYGLVKEATILKKLLSHQWMIILSNGSYGFYLMHTGWVQYKLSQFNPLPDKEFILLWITAVLVYYLYEKNFINFLRQYVKIP